MYERHASLSCYPHQPCVGKTSVPHHLEATAFLHKTQARAFWIAAKYKGPYSLIIASPAARAAFPSSFLNRPHFLLIAAFMQTTHWGRGAPSLGSGQQTFCCADFRMAAALAFPGNCQESSLLLFPS